MQTRLQQLRQELIEDKIIFTGEIRDNAGNVRCSAGETIKDDFLIEKFDWFARGVEVLD